MKYYVYVSDAKINMLYSQIGSSGASSRESSLGFDLKVLKGEVKESRGIPENSFTRLDEVVQRLHDSNLVGTRREPKAYIAGDCSMV